MKRKYYLHDSLEFLLPHVKHHREGRRQFSNQPPSGIEALLDSISTDNEYFGSFDAFSDVSDEDMAPPNNKEIKKEIIKNESPSQELAHSSSLTTRSDDPIIQFINGLMPDIQALSVKNQRKFKFKLVTMLEELHEEEENERMSKDDIFYIHMSILQMN